MDSKKSSDITQGYLEPWMRGTHLELDPLRRAVVHALELTVDDVERKASGLDTRELFLRPDDLPPAAFHLRHIVRSLDRLLSYAEDRQLTASQLEALSTEHALVPDGTQIYAEFQTGMESALSRIQAIPQEVHEQNRGIGRKRLPTTVAGLLIHCAEHTQRHAGQLVLTAKLARRLA